MKLEIIGVSCAGLSKVLACVRGPCREDWDIGDCETFAVRWERGSPADISVNLCKLPKEVATLVFRVTPSHHGEHER